MKIEDEIKKFIADLELIRKAKERKDVKEIQAAAQVGFERAAKWVKDFFADEELDIEHTFEIKEKTDIYKWFKQAQFGDCNTKQPPIYKMEARYKWQGWDSVKSTSKEEAQEQYITVVLKAVQAHVAKFKAVLDARAEEEAEANAEATVDNSADSIAKAKA